MHPPDRTEVFPHLYVGDDRSRRGFHGLIIDVRGMRDPRERPNPRVVWVPVFGVRGDGEWLADPELAQKVVDLIANNIGQRDVLVHCTGGIERSPAIAALYLVRCRGYTVTAAYARIRMRRPQVQEEPEILPLTFDEWTR